MQKLSKGLYLGWIIGGEVAGIICVTIGVIILIAAGVMAGITEGKFSGLNMGLVGAGIFFFLLGMALTIVAAIFGYVLLYKAWQAIQDGQPRTTPGKAVGFLFIPFFNFYWMFVAYLGWAKDYNAYISTKGFNLTKMPEGLFLAFPIIVLCSGIPYLGSVAGISIIVIFIIISYQMIDAVNGIIDARNAGASTPIFQQAPISTV